MFDEFKQLSSEEVFEYFNQLQERAGIIILAALLKKYGPKFELTDKDLITSSTAKVFTYRKNPNCTIWELQDNEKI